MLETIKHHLAAILTRIAANETLLKAAQRRRHNWRKRAEARWERVKAAKDAGESDREVERLTKRAERARSRARFWVDRIKLITRKIDKLEVTQESVEAELSAYRRKHKIRFVGQNKVRGEGVDPSKLQVTAMLRCEVNYLKGEQPGYYSQEGGTRAYSHTLYHYPQGHIWDCSTWNDGINYACGLESPSGHEYLLGGYTGTELAESKAVSRADLRAGDFIVYLRYPGDTVGHHVERILSVTKEETMGHGDSAIDRNSRFDIFGDGLYVFRRRDDLCPTLN